MPTRHHRRSVIGEVLPPVVAGLVVEAFLIWVDLSGIIPGSELLFRLGLLFTIVVVVPGGILVLVAGGVQRARASESYHRMSFDDLQAARPPIVESMRSDTVFGNEVQAWFEALFDHALAGKEQDPEHVRLLTGTYVELLKGLDAYIATLWPTIPSPDENGQVALAGPATEIRHLEGTIRWFHRLAVDQAALVGGRQHAARVTWNSDLFEALPISSGGESRTLTSCTPERLRAEIDRLSAAIEGANMPDSG